MRAHPQVHLRRRLRARHRIRVAGELEELHEHDFGIEACFSGADDAAGRFGEALEALLRPLDGSDLTELVPELTGYPSAERIARALFDGLASRGLPIRSVAVGEAPGCTARFLAP